MQIFIDSADASQIRKWLQFGVVDGATTNPSIMLRSGVRDLREASVALAELLGDRPLSVEVTTNDPELMLAQGRELARWAPNIVVKIPVINEDGEPCLGVIHALEQDGIRVNTTACLSYGQAILAAKAGATYVSLFAGRIADEGHDASRVIRATRTWLDDWGYKAKIIVGSIRAVYDIQAAAEAGAHVITIPPEFLPKLVDHKYSRETVRQFVKDAEQALTLLDPVLDRRHAMSDRMLVTGGAGFIGSHTVDLLLERGYRVRVLDSLQPRVHPQGRPDYLPGDVEFIQGDVADRSDLSQALRDVQAVFHLAAYQDYQPDFSTFIHTNTESTALLFELIVEEQLDIQKIVLASSQSVSGEGRYSCPVHGAMVPEQRPIDQLERGDWEIRCSSCGEAMRSLLIDEETISPHTAYAISKYAIELLARSLGRRYGISTACMRYTYVQGSRNSFFNAYSGICRRFALQVLNGLQPVCFEDGKQLRDYVNVRDVARANVVALEHMPPGHHVFNVGGGHPVTVIEFARIMLDACGSALEPAIPGQFRVGDTRHTVSDITAIGRLGWAPAVPVEQNVREYLEWMSGFRDTVEYLNEAERVMRQMGVVRSVSHI